MLWGLVVSNYTRRLLTQKTDKLLAFAAVAEQFDRIWQPEWHPGRYVAGLWERFLPRDLLWYRELARNEWLDDELRPRLAGEDYAAPTWAWPSVDGHVITRTGTSPDSNGGAVDTCVVLACDVALLDQRLPYGRVSEGHLKLRTVLVPACVIIESPQVDPQRRAEYGESFYFRVFAFAAHPKGELEYEPEGPSPLDCDMAVRLGTLQPYDTDPKTPVVVSGHLVRERRLVAIGWGAFTNEHPLLKRVGQCDIYFDSPERARAEDSWLVVISRTDGGLDGGYTGEGLIVTSAGRGNFRRIGYWSMELKNIDSVGLELAAWLRADAEEVVVDLV